MVTPKRLAELERRERRRAVIRTSVIVAAAWVLVVGLYYALPARRDSANDDAVRLIVGLLLFGVFLGWQTNQIVKAELPELRAVQALGVVIPLFLVVFASIYLSFSHSSVASFSQPLDHTGALYFTITIFSTVGFGDITPRTDPTRIIVSLQMLLDLAIIGAVVRLLLDVAKTGLARDRQSGSAETE